MFCLAKKDMSRENKLRWRGKKREVAEQPRRKELNVVEGGGWVVTTCRGHWLPVLQGNSQKSEHRGRHKAFMQLLQCKPNTPVHNVQ